ncbi:MAG: FAD-dependent oxidoreductase [Albidovulum sp.]
MSERIEIAVVGAGVIGLAIAYRLALGGREVMILDPEPPGSGASYGNAGTIADYAVQPVGTPGVLRNLPSLLFDKTSPLAIRRAALPTLAPWLMRFARQSLPAAARRNAVTLAGLLADAAPRWRDLAIEIGAAGLMQDRGCLYLYEHLNHRRAAEADIAFRKDLGITVEMLSSDELAKLEPDLPLMDGGGAYFPQALFMTDPGRMVAALATAARAAGVQFRKARVDHLQRDNGRVSLSGAGLSLVADRVVLAAGAHSRALARQAGDRVPLETERGYHVEYDMKTPRLSRPSCPTSRGFYMCPMAGRLRVAGTVELGGLTAPASQHRIDQLDKGARAIFADLPPPSRSWMGFRPSLPDSLPVIGASCAGPDVIHAFGHGHIGLTLAPATAAIVEGILSANDPNAAGNALGPGRFRGIFA